VHLKLASTQLLLHKLLVLLLLQIRFSRPTRAFLRPVCRSRRFLRLDRYAISAFSQPIDCKIDQCDKAFVVFHLRGYGLHNWQYLFLIEGILTILIAVVAWFWLPADPGSAWFLDADERLFAVSHINVSHQ
jgi:hypothetical protein